MREYTIVKFIINGINYFCIWFSDENDGFIDELGKIISFSTIGELSHYSKARDLELNEEVTEISIDLAVEWLKNKKTINCNYLNLYWNIMTDISTTLNIRFLGNKQVKHINYIYNKLFYGCNVPAIRGEGKKYIPHWGKKEVKILSKIVRDGLRIVKWYIV